jgi:hypothetical protein
MTEGRLNAIRCAAYMTIAALTPLAALVEGTSKQSYWPSAPAVCASLLSGAIAAAVALRAYLDGSNERWQQKQEPKP